VTIKPLAIGIKRYIPWWGKIATKLLLSQLPNREKFLNEISIFSSEPTMEEPIYAYNTFKEHLNRAKPEKGFVSLELGPGTSLFSGMISWALGGSTSYLVDVGDFALKDIQLYQAMADFLNKKGLPSPNLQNAESLKSVLESCSAHYLVSGLSSLQAIPNESVDFIWSQAVLEHIRKAEFLDIMRELRRIIRNQGVCTHYVDFKDHLDCALNNLRFSEPIWESDFMARAGFYTNRIRYSQMLELFEKAGFEVEVLEVQRWDRLPTPRENLSKEFRNLSEEELCISDLFVLLKPA